MSSLYPPTNRHPSTINHPSFRRFICSLPPTLLFMARSNGSDQLKHRPTHLVLRLHSKNQNASCLSPNPYRPLQRRHRFHSLFYLDSRSNNLLFSLINRHRGLSRQPI
ncbi:hypothetical protein HYC85_006040 [Camellia sinensis]|uniref:Uncharacterized protein n=1 Tax=Camellia sinensis TaxID=4442 RepID=A0A7J7I227_CAMSI|nr:hypothetical protein HYC85_006040 [Camellia sinensis]